MTNARQRRLAGLEKRSNNSAMPYLIISLRFVDSEKYCRSDYAETVDGRRWQREPAETPEEFERRVTTILDNERQGHAALVLFQAYENGPAQ